MLRTLVSIYDYEQIMLFLGFNWYKIEPGENNTIVIKIPKFRYMFSFLKLRRLRREIEQSVMVGTSFIIKKE